MIQFGGGGGCFAGGWQTPVFAVGVNDGRWYIIVFRKEFQNPSRGEEVGWVTLWRLFVRGYVGSLFCVILVVDVSRR